MVVEQYSQAEDAATVSAQKEEAKANGLSAADALLNEAEDAMKLCDNLLLNSLHELEEATAANKDERL